MENRKPLAGLRVLDLSQNLPGPYVTMVLASLGAEVIKIEPPKGDTSRFIPELFQLLNKGKKSIVLDLKNPEDRAQMKQLLDNADIFVESFRPGVMKKFGLDASTLQKTHPHIIYCSLSGFGQEGPYASFPSHDINLQALSGAVFMTDFQGELPHSHPLPIADFASAMQALSAILVALYQRDLHQAQGAQLDISLFETLFSWSYLWSEGLSTKNISLTSLKKKLQHWIEQERQKHPLTQNIFPKKEWLSYILNFLEARIEQSNLFKNIDKLGLHSLPHYDIFQTKDKRFVALAIVDEDRFWRQLCAKLGWKQLASLPLLGRFIASKPLHLLLRRAFLKKTLEEWLEIFQDGDIPITPVLSPQEAKEHPQVAHQIDVNRHSSLPLLSFLDKTSSRAPKLGEHNSEFLS